MNEPHEDLDRLLRPGVDPLAPPPGAFDRARRSARRRRWARTAMSASAAVMIIAAGVPGTLFILQAREEGTPRPPAVQPFATQSNPPRGKSPSATPGAGETLGTGGSWVGPPGGPVPPGFVPESVTFVSRQLGWAIGQAPCSEPPCTSVVRTADGGRSWEGIPAPRTGGGDQAGGVSGLRFADARNGWAYGPGLWSTHDGGETWGQVGAPGGGRVLALAASAGKQVVAVVSACGKDARCERFRVYGTPTGTDQWRPLPGATGALGSEAAGLSLTIREGSAYVASRTSGGSAVWSGPVNGGSDWVRRDAPCEDGTHATAITSASDGELALLCVGRPATGGQPKTVYVSGDRGRTWDRGGQVPRGGLVTSAAATPAKIFVATNHGLLTSASGGRQWRRTLAGRSLVYVGFTTARQGVVVPSGGRSGELLFSYDAGRTWSPVRFP